MKPVPCCEIVVGYGEFLYRKSSKAEPDACSVSHDLESSYVGCSEIMSGAHGFPVGFPEPWYRSLSRHRNAFSLHCSIILATNLWTSKVLRS